MNTVFSFTPRALTEAPIGHQSIYHNLPNLHLSHSSHQCSHLHPDSLLFTLRTRAVSTTYETSVHNNRPVPEYLLPQSPIITANS